MQNIPEGYKNTEVGVIPEDWEVKTYGDIFKYLATATYSRAELTENDDVKYVHYGDIHTKWYFFLDVANSYLPTVRSEQVKNYNFLQDGDIIMADASEDYAGICKSVEVKNIGAVKAISGLHTFLLRDSNGFFVNGYKGYIHFNRMVKDQFDRLATGLKVYGVSKTNLKFVQIPLPPTLAEQTAIASALSDADALISRLETLIAKKRDIKQGAMQKLLQPKEGWEVKKLGEVCGIRKGQLITDSTRINGNIPVIAGGKTPAYFHNKPNRIGKTITISASGASAGYVAFHDYSIFASDCSTIEESENYSIEFLYYLMQLLQEKIYKMQTGGAQPHIHPSDLNPIQVSIPTIEEQTRIATILSDMDTEIQTLESKLEKYKNIKLGMMQNLLTGKVRLV